MYDYRSRNKLGLGSILLIILFIFTIIALAILFFIDKGKFWDILPIVSIVVIILSLIFAIFNMAKRADGGFLFLIFFLIFLSGLVLSSLFGPFMLNKNAQKAIEQQNYNEAIKNYNEIVSKFPTSKYYDDAIKILPFYYDKIGDNENTIKYLNIAIDKKIVDPNSIDVKKILSNAYSKIAEKDYENQDYNGAALNYVMAINVLKEISSKFPKSDEAFIASYKIPQYLYNAADSYKKSGNFNQSIEILKELIKDYPDNDYAKQAEDLIFSNYIEQSLNLISESKYNEALDSYFIALDLINSKENQNSQFNYYDLQIFSKIPQDTLLEYASNLIKKGQNEYSLNILNYLYNNYPERSEQINIYYAICKINIISKSNYENLPQINEYMKIKNPGNFMLTIYNKTDKDITLYFSLQNESGLINNNGSLFKLKAKNKIDITLPNGGYKIACEFDNETTPVYFGEFNFEENKRYLQTFSVQATSDNKVKNNTSTNTSQSTTTTQQVTATTTTDNTNPQSQQ